MLSSLQIIVFSGANRAIYTGPVFVSLQKHCFSPVSTQKGNSRSPKTVIFENVLELTSWIFVSTAKMHKLLKTDVIAPSLFQSTTQACLLLVFTFWTWRVSFVFRASISCFGFISVASYSTTYKPGMVAVAFCIVLDVSVWMKTYLEMSCLQWYFTNDKKKNSFEKNCVFVWTNRFVPKNSAAVYPYIIVSMLLVML